MITSTDHAGRVCTLTHNGQPVKPNEILEDFRGDQYRITGGRAPHKDSSAGMIYTDAGYFYPSVFNCKWTPDTQADTMKQPEQFIIIYGNPIDGFAHIGPFNSRDEATHHADGDIPSHWWIVQLEAPNYATDESRSNGPHQ